MSPLYLLLLRRHGDRQGAANGFNRSVEGKLADQQIIIEQVLLDVAFGGENADGHRQIVSRSFLFDIRGSEIDGDALSGKSIAAVLDRGANPVFAFFDGAFRQADGGELRQP